jgi:hypothetical protein
VRGVDLLASPFAGASCRSHALTCTSLCHEGGRCVRRDFRGEGVRWHSCRHPRCCRNRDVIVIEWLGSCRVRVWLWCPCWLCMVTSITLMEPAPCWGSPWLPVWPEGSTCPLARRKTRCGGSGAFDDAAGARARWRDVARDTYRVRGLSARLGRDRVCSLCFWATDMLSVLFRPLMVGLQTCRVPYFTPCWVPRVFWYPTSIMF